MFLQPTKKSKRIFCLPPHQTCAPSSHLLHKQKNKTRTKTLCARARSTTSKLLCVKGPRFVVNCTRDPPINPSVCVYFKCLFFPCKWIYRNNCQEAHHPSQSKNPDHLYTKQLPTFVTCSIAQSSRIHHVRKYTTARQQKQERPFKVVCCRRATWWRFFFVCNICHCNIWFQSSSQLLLLQKRKNRHFPATSKK